MKPTAMKCVDGKRHNWNLIISEVEFSRKRDYKWCKKCGCHTEFIDGKRCTSDSGERDYIEIPSCVK